MGASVQAGLFNVKVEYVKKLRDSALEKSSSRSRELNDEIKFEEIIDIDSQKEVALSLNDLSLIINIKEGKVPSYSVQCKDSDGIVFSKNNININDKITRDVEGPFFSSSEYAHYDYTTVTIEVTK